jgi:hypothetical protein
MPRPRCISRVHRPLAAVLAVLLVAACSGAATPVVTDGPGPGGVEAPAEPGATVAPRPAATPAPTPTPAASPTAAEVVRTYTGTWTVTERVTDYPYPEDPNDPYIDRLGKTMPGTLEIRCGGLGGSAYCGVTMARGGESFSVTSIPVVGPGKLSGVQEEFLTNCGQQIHRWTREVVFDDTAATATHAFTPVPRTCTDASGTLYGEDSTWSFEGVAG